jgi:hypothetical protein
MTPPRSDARARWPTPGSAIGRIDNQHSHQSAGQDGSRHRTAPLRLQSVADADGGRCRAQAVAASAHAGTTPRPELRQAAERPTASRHVELPQAAERPTVTRHAELRQAEKRRTVTTTSKPRRAPASKRTTSKTMAAGARSQAARARETSVTLPPADLANPGGAWPRHRASASRIAAPHAQHAGGRARPNRVA